MAQFDIKKIKRDGSELTFDYRKKKDSHLSTHISKFCEMARKEFYDAFNRLSIGFCQGLKFVFVDRAVLMRFVPVGVTYGEDKDLREFAVIVCDYIIPGTSLKVTLKSPSYCLAFTQEEGKIAGYWDVDTSRLLTKLREEAQLFLAGQRAQGSLFDAPVEAIETQEAEGMSDELLDEAIPFAGDTAQSGCKVLTMRG